MDNKLIFTIFTAVILIIAGLSIFGIIKASSNPTIDLSQFTELSMGEEKVIENPRINELLKQNKELQKLLNEEKNAKLEIPQNTSSTQADTQSGNTTTGPENQNYSSVDLNLNNCEQVIEDLKDQIDDSEKNEKKKERDVDRIREQIKYADLELDAAITGNASQEEIDRIERDIDTLNDDLKSAEDNENIAEDDLSSLRQQLDETQDTCRVLKRSSLLDSIAKANYDSNSCSIASDSIQELIDSESDEKDKAKDTIYERKQDVTNAENELQVAEDLVENLTQSHANTTLIVQAEHDREIALRRLGNQQDDLREAQRDLDEIEKNIRDSREILDEIRRRCNDFR